MPALVFTSRKTRAKSRTRHASIISGSVSSLAGSSCGRSASGIGQAPHCEGYATSLDLYFP
jgi:hypothetical protein